MEEILYVVEVIASGTLVGVIVVFIARFFSKLIAENLIVSIIVATIVTTILAAIVTFDKLITKNPTAAIVLATIVAAVVGASMTFVAQWFSDSRRQKQRIEGFYKAVYRELKEVWNLYNQEVGARWEELKSKRTDVFRTNLSLTQDYFTVYRSNADLIGQTPKSDLELRSKIVEIYTLLKVLIDYYKQNNKLLDENWKIFDEDGNLLDEIGELWNKDREQSYMTSGNSVDKRIAIHRSEIINFTQRLRDRHFRFKRLNKELFSLLEQKFPELSDRDSADDSL